MSPQTMLCSVIFVIILIMNCLFSWVLNGPTKDVKFCDLSNLFDIELSFSVGR